LPTTFRTSTFAFTLPGGDYLDSGFRVDVRPAGITRGETRRVRANTRPAVSLG